jgi:hypothetical protein
MKKFLIPALSLLAIAALIFWQKERIFSTGVKIPFVTREPVVLLAENLEKAGLSFSQAPILSENTIVASISGIKVFFDINKDFSSQTKALQLILARRTIDKMPKEIDLRFSKVIVRY